MVSTRRQKQQTGASDKNDDKQQQHTEDDIKENDNSKIETSTDEHASLREVENGDNGIKKLNQLASQVPGLPRHDSVCSDLDTEEEKHKDSTNEVLNTDTAIKKEPREEAIGSKLQNGPDAKVNGSRDIESLRTKKDEQDASANDVQCGSVSAQDDARACSSNDDSPKDRSGSTKLDTNDSRTRKYAEAAKDNMFLDQDTLSSSGKVASTSSASLEHNMAKKRTRQDMNDPSSKRHQTKVEVKQQSTTDFTQKDSKGMERVTDKQYTSKGDATIDTNQIESTRDVQDTVKSKSGYQTSLDPRSSEPQTNQNPLLDTQIKPQHEQVGVEIGSASATALFRTSKSSPNPVKLDAAMHELNKASQESTPASNNVERKPGSSARTSAVEAPGTSSSAQTNNQTQLAHAAANAISGKYEYEVTTSLASEKVASIKPANNYASSDHNKFSLDNSRSGQPSTQQTNPDAYRTSELVHSRFNTHNMTGFRDTNQKYDATSATTIPRANTGSITQNTMSDHDRIMRAAVSQGLKALRQQNENDRMQEAQLQAQVRQQKQQQEKQQPSLNVEGEKEDEEDYEVSLDDRNKALMQKLEQMSRFGDQVLEMAPSTMKEHTSLSMAQTNPINRSASTPASMTAVTLSQGSGISAGLPENIFNASANRSTASAPPLSRSTYTNINEFAPQNGNIIRASVDPSTRAANTHATGNQTQITNQPSTFTAAVPGQQNTTILSMHSTGPYPARSPITVPQASCSGHQNSAAPSANSILSVPTTLPVTANDTAFPVQQRVPIHPVRPNVPMPPAVANTIPNATSLPRHQNVSAPPTHAPFQMPHVSKVMAGTVPMHQQSSVPSGNSTFSQPGAGNNMISKNGALFVQETYTVPLANPTHPLPTGATVADMNAPQPFYQNATTSNVNTAASFSTNSATHADASFQLPTTASTPATQTFATFSAPAAVTDPDAYISHAPSGMQHAHQQVPYQQNDPRHEMSATTSDTKPAATGALHTNAVAGLDQATVQNTRYRSNSNTSNCRSRSTSPLPPTHLGGQSGESVPTSNDPNPFQQYYHPYLLQNETSLVQARTRLHTALEQTRYLRQLFTDRIWEKYHILLEPVEGPTIAPIVQRCSTRPSFHSSDLLLDPEGGSNNASKDRGVRQKVTREQNLSSWEKRLEGIVVPPVVPMATGTSSALPSGAGGGSGGFANVLLPEHSNQQHAQLLTQARSTLGEKRISGASHAAAQLLLERARANELARRHLYRDVAKMARTIVFGENKSSPAHLSLQLDDKQKYELQETVHAKYGQSGPIAIQISQQDLTHAKEGRLPYASEENELELGKQLLSHMPRGGALQFQPNTHVGAMGTEILTGANAGVELVQGETGPLLTVEEVAVAATDENHAPPSSQHDKSSDGAEKAASLKGPPTEAQATGFFTGGTSSEISPSSAPTLLPEAAGPVPIGRIETVQGSSEFGSAPDPIKHADILQPSLAETSAGKLNSASREGERTISATDVGSIADVAPVTASEVVKVDTTASPAISAADPTTPSTTVTTLTTVGLESSLSSPKSRGGKTLSKIKIRAPSLSASPKPSPRPSPGSTLSKKAAAAAAAAASWTSPTFSPSPGGTSGTSRSIPPKTSYGMDLSLDEYMILYHRSTGQYRSRMRHRGVPPFTIAWGQNFSVDQHVLNKEFLGKGGSEDAAVDDLSITSSVAAMPSSTPNEKSVGYITARMGLRDAFCRKRLVQKWQEAFSLRLKRQVMEKGASLDDAIQTVSAAFSGNSAGSSRQLSGGSSPGNAPSLPALPLLGSPEKKRTSKKPSDALSSTVDLPVPWQWMESAHCLSLHENNTLDNEKEQLANIMQMFQMHERSQDEPASNLPSTWVRSLKFKRRKVDSITSAEAKSAPSSLYEVNDEPEQRTSEQKDLTAFLAKRREETKLAPPQDRPERLTPKSTDGAGRTHGAEGDNSSQERCSRNGNEGERPLKEGKDKTARMVRNAAEMGGEAALNDCKSMNGVSIEVTETRQRNASANLDESNDVARNCNRMGDSHASPTRDVVNVSSARRGLSEVALACALHSGLGKTDAVRPETGEPASSTAFSVLVALGLLKCQDDKEMPPSSNGSRIGCKGELLGSRIRLPSTERPAPKFVKGQKIEALWHSLHEAYFSSSAFSSTATTPHGSDGELGAFSGFSAASSRRESLSKEAINSTFEPVTGKGSGLAPQAPSAGASATTAEKAVSALVAPGANSTLGSKDSGMDAGAKGVDLSVPPSVLPTPALFHPRSGRNNKILHGLQGRGHWYPATITNVIYKPHLVEGLDLEREKSGIGATCYRYDVAYDDGDVDEGLKFHQIRPRVSLHQDGQHPEQSGNTIEDLSSKPQKISDENDQQFNPLRWSKNLVQEGESMPGEGTSVQDKNQPISQKLDQTNHIVSDGRSQPKTQAQCEALPPLSNIPEEKALLEKGIAQIATPVREAEKMSQKEDHPEPEHKRDLKESSGTKNESKDQETDEAKKSVSLETVSNKRRSSEPLPMASSTKRDVKRPKKGEAIDIRSEVKVKEKEKDSHQTEAQALNASRYGETTVRSRRQSAPLTAERGQKQPTRNSFVQMSGQGVNLESFTERSRLEALLMERRSLQMASLTAGMPNLIGTSTDPHSTIWRQNAVGNVAAAAAAGYYEAVRSQTGSAPSAAFLDPAISRYSQLTRNATQVAASALFEHERRAALLAAQGSLYGSMADTRLLNAYGAMAPLPLPYTGANNSASYADFILSSQLANGQAHASGLYGANANPFFAARDLATFGASGQMFGTGHIDPSLHAAALERASSQARAAAMMGITASGSSSTGLPFAHLQQQAQHRQHIQAHNDAQLQVHAQLQAQARAILSAGETTWASSAMLSRQRALSDLDSATAERLFTNQQLRIEASAATSAALAAMVRPSSALPSASSPKSSALSSAKAAGEQSDCQAGKSSSTDKAREENDTKLLDDAKKMADVSPCTGLPRSSSAPPSREIDQASSLSFATKNDNTKPTASVTKPPQISTREEKSFTQEVNGSDKSSDSKVHPSKGTLPGSVEITTIDALDRKIPEELSATIPDPPVGSSLLNKDLSLLIKLIVQGNFPSTLYDWLKPRASNLSLRDTEVEKNFENSDKSKMMESGSKGETNEEDEELEQLAKDVLVYMNLVSAALPIKRTIIEDKAEEIGNMLMIEGVSLFRLLDPKVREALYDMVTIWTWNNILPDISKQEQLSEKGSKHLIKFALFKCLDSLANDTFTAQVVKRAEISESDIGKVLGIASASLSQRWFTNDFIDALMEPENLALAHSILEKNRMKSLQMMIYERALLSTLIARSFTMSEAFAFAYAKFMIVAGDALGHARVCEITYDDTLFDDARSGAKLTTNFGSIWSMMPYDLVRSEECEPQTIMEDPCKPRYGGFTVGMDAEEMEGRAHAKALLHRTTFLMQQKHGLQGGVENFGPYGLIGQGETGSQSGQRATEDCMTVKVIPPELADHLVMASSSGTPRSSTSSLKRKSSFSGREIDATGGAKHVGAVLYPTHYCAPLQVPCRENVGSLPYGTHALNEAEEGVPDGMVRSTKPIDWSKIVEMFKPVAVQDTAEVDFKDESGTAAPILAPVVKKRKCPAWESSSSDESSSEGESSEEEMDESSDKESEKEVGQEDISDAAVLQRHKGVLAVMKKKIDAAAQEHRGTRKASRSS